MKISNIETNLDYKYIVRMIKSKNVPVEFKKQYDNVVWHLEYLNDLMDTVENKHRANEQKQSKISILHLLFNDLMHDPDVNNKLNEWPMNDFTMRNPVSDLLEVDSYDFINVINMINQYRYLIYNLLNLFDFPSNNFLNFGQYYLTLNRYFPNDFNFIWIPGSKLYSQDGLKYLASNI